MNTLHQPTALTGRATSPSKPKPPCATHPDDWDLDVGSPDIWQEAIRTCHGCPILAQCQELAATLTEHGTPPRSMIWAGVGYDVAGSAIEDLDRHRARPIEHKQPLRIVRTGPVYAHPAGERQHDGTISASPRRTIVLRRRSLPPTGTGNA